MSDLFSSLSMASRSLEAQRLGLDAVGQNIANVNTPGFTRRQVDFASVAPADPLSAGGGVEVIGVRSARDLLLEQRLLVEQPAAGRESAVADGLSVVEAALGKSGESLDARLSAFFDAFATLAQDPTSSTARQGVILQGRELAGAFEGMADRFNAARRDANTRIGGIVDQVNDLGQRIAGLNEAIARAGGDSPTSLSLRDDLHQAVEQLSQLVDISAIQRKDGGIDLSIANGRALVIGANSYEMSVGTNAEGMTTILTGGVDVTGEIAAGQLAGLLELRDVLVPDYLGKLDAMAYGVVQQVNALHTAGIDLNGAAGESFFTPIAAPTGAASAMQVNATVAANPRLVAAGTVSAGDNQNARALAALRDARVLNDGTATFTDAWADLAYRVGQDSSTARSEVKNRQEIVRQVDALRDAVSGVSLDEEAMMMMKFQRAYEANARYFQTIDAAISVLMSLGAGN